MKKVAILTALLCLLFAGTAFAVRIPPPPSYIIQSADCAFLTWFGALCHDTDDGKLYKWDGAALVELAAAAGTGDITDVWNCATADCAGLVAGAADYLNATSASYIIPFTVTADCSAVTAEGRACWDSDNDTLYVGDGAAALAISSVLGATVESAEITNGTIVDADINAAAAIAWSKMAALTSANILLGSAGNVATVTPVTGDISINNAGLTAIVANAVALATDTTGNYVATIADAGSAVFTVSGSGSENAAVTLDLATGGVTSTHILNNTIVTADLAAALTFADGDLIDLSGITHTGATDEGLVIPNWANVAPTSDKKFLAADGSNLKLYNGGWVTIGSTAAPIDATYLTLTNDTTLTQERVMTAGTNGIDFVDSGANGTLTINFDATEVGNVTWGAGAGITWTFDASAGTDPTMIFGDGSVTASVLTVTGALTANGGIVMGTGDGFTVNSVNLLSGDELDGTKIKDADYGDVTISAGGAWAVEDDSHAHGSTTITLASTNLSDTTNLARLDASNTFTGTTNTVGNANTDILAVQATARGVGRAFTIDDDTTTTASFATGTGSLYVQSHGEFGGNIYEGGTALSGKYQGLHAYLTDIAGITANQGDIIYFNGTNWVDLAPGTLGYFLQTRGAAANPIWAAGSATGVAGAFAAGWNGDSAAPQKNDVYDYLVQIDPDISGTVDIDELGNPGSSTSRAMGAYTWTLTSGTDGWGGVIISNTQAAITTASSLLTLNFTDTAASGDMNFLNMNSGVSTNEWSFDETGLFIGSGNFLDWASNDIRLTHSSNTLTLSGGALDLSSGGITNVGTIADDGAISVISSGGAVTIESVVFTTGAISAVTSITDGTASWTSSNLSGFADITLTDDLTVGDDLLLASGAVISWDTTDITLTHSANTLTLADGNVVLGGTLSAGAAGFSVDADGDVTAKSLTITKVPTYASTSLLYEATTDETNGVGWKGPASRASDLYLQFSNSDPAANQFMLFPAPTGDTSTAVWTTYGTFAGADPTITLSDSDDAAGSGNLIFASAYSRDIVGTIQVDEGGTAVTYMTFDGVNDKVIVGPAAVVDNNNIAFSILGDADADGTATTSESLTFTLTANATPTSSTWAIADTQGAGISIISNGTVTIESVVFTAGAMTSVTSVDASGAYTGASINLTADTNQIVLNSDGTNAKITLTGTGATSDKVATFPNVTGTVAVATASTTATQAMFATAVSGAPEFRAIADADIPDTITVSNYLALAGGTMTGNLALDDGTGNSPTITFQDQTNETVVFEKVDSGYLTITTVAADGVNIITGNLKVGGGSPGQTINGEDFYATGLAEIDGMLYADGGITATTIVASTSVDISGAAGLILSNDETITNAADGVVVVSDNVTIGDNTDGQDYVLTFDGNAADLTLTWMEDEHELRITDSGGEDLTIDLDTATDNEIGISSQSSANQINMGSLNLVTTGTILGAVNVVVTTDGSESPVAGQMYGTMFIADHGTATSDTTYTLPAAAAGMAACFYDNGGGTGGITIEIDGSDVIILDGTALTAGNTIDSPGIAGDGANGDFICLMAIDGVSWITLGRSGTWVDGGAT